MLAAVIAGATSPVMAGAAELYRPDPTLVEAAKKEGQVLWYATLIVDQIVRPLIKAFQAQVPGIDVKFVRLDSRVQVTRLTTEARVGADADIRHEMVKDMLHCERRVGQRFPDVLKHLIQFSS